MQGKECLTLLMTVFASPEAATMISFLSLQRYFVHIQVCECVRPYLYPSPPPTHTHLFFNRTCLYFWLPVTGTLFLSQGGKG